MSWDHTKEEYCETFRELLDAKGLVHALEWAWDAYEYALAEGTESSAVTARAAMEMRKHLILQRSWTPELSRALQAYDTVRCCSRDYHGDGHCDRHAAPGVPLKGNVRPPPI